MLEVLYKNWRHFDFEEQGLTLIGSKFQNARLQGYLFSQKLNKDTPL